jgi:hypothetical protein
MKLRFELQPEERANAQVPSMQADLVLRVQSRIPVVSSAGNEAACCEKLCSSCWNELPAKEKAADLKALTRDFSLAISNTRPQVSPTISHVDAMHLVHLWFGEMAAANLEHGGSDTGEDLRRYADPLLEQDPEWREFLNFHCGEEMRLRGIK